MKRKTVNGLATRIMAASIAATVAITGLPVAALAEEDNNTKEVTIEVVQDDVSNAQEAVTTAGESVDAAANADSTVSADNVTTEDVKKALGQAQTDLGATQSNANQVSTYLGELDPLVSAATTAEGLASNADGDMLILMQPVTDENGVEQTKLVAMIPELDENGEPVVDENGNAVFRQVDYADLQKKTENSADNAISSAKTANTSGSESVARAAAQTAHDELDVAEAGLLDAQKAVDDAEKKVGKAEEELKNAEAAKKAAQDKYDLLKAELSNGQTNATAANEQLKAAERYAKALEQEAQNRYEEYIGGKENLKMLQKIDDCNKDLENYIAANISKNADGSLVEYSDKKNGIKGYDSDSLFFTKARNLSLALLEYSIKSGKLQAYNPDDDNLVTFEDGYKLVIGDNFKVTLTSYSVPENLTADDVKCDENGNPYIEPNEETTNYEFDVKSKKWKDDKALPGEETAKVAGKMIKVEGSDEKNRVVVTFRDAKGKEIEGLPQFYFNYKVNPDGTVYYYQRTFTKDTENVSGNSEAYLVSEGTTGFFKNGDSSNDNNNIDNLKLKKDEVIVDKDENTKVYVNTGAAGEIKAFKPIDKEKIPERAELVKVEDERGNKIDKEEIEYSIVDYNGQDIVMKTKYKFYYSETLEGEKDQTVTATGNKKKDFIKDINNDAKVEFVSEKDVKINGSNKTDQDFSITIDGVKTVYSVHYVHGNGNSWSYTITKNVYKLEETRYIAENSKGYKIQGTYTAVKSDPVYAGYEGYTNETGITWLSDSVKPGGEHLAQNRAVANGQLALDENGNYINNFDYKKALEYKHAAEEYAQASADVVKASAKTQQLEDDINKLTVKYNGIKAENPKDNKEPDNELYNELQRIEKELAKLRQNLNNAKQELADAKIEQENLAKKVEEARKAVEGIDLSRFNVTSDDNGGSDDSSPSGDTTVITTVANNSSLAGTQTAPVNTVTRRNTNVAANNAVADNSQATNTVKVDNNQTPKSANPGKDAGADDKNIKDSVSIGDNLVALAASPVEETKDLNWWLLLLALLIAGATGLAAYENQKRKAKAANNNINQ